MTALRRPTVVVTALGLLAGLLDGGQLALALADGLGPSNDLLVDTAVLAGFVVSPLLVALTGYWAGNRVALSDRYGGLLVRFALCGAPAVFVGYLLAFAIPSDVSVWRFLPSASIQLLFASVEFPLYGLAGAAVAHLRA